MNDELRKLEFFFFMRACPDGGADLMIMPVPEVDITDEAGAAAMNLMLQGAFPVIKIEHQGYEFTFHIIKKLFWKNTLIEEHFIKDSLDMIIERYGHLATEVTA